MRNNNPKLDTETLLSILDLQECGIIIIDKDGLITQMNKAAEAITGWPEREALHQDIGLVYGANFSDATKDRPAAQHILESCPNTAPELLELTSLSGKKYMVKHVSTPLFDEDSHLSGVILSFINVSRNTALEEEAYQSQATLQAIMNNFPLPAGIINLKGELITVNNALAELSGLTIEDCLNQPYEDIFPDENIALHKKQDQEVLQTASSIRYEFSLIRSRTPDQSAVQKCTLTKFPLFNKNKEIHSIGFICSKLIDTSLEKEEVLSKKNHEEVLPSEDADHDTLAAPLKIIVVDDDCQMRALTQDILETAGFDVICPGSPVEAVEQLSIQSDSIALLITDIMMPEMDGYQLAEKALKINPGIKILLASGFNSYLTEENPLSTLPQINKPFSSKQLLDMVFALLDNNLGK